MVQNVIIIWIFENENAFSQKPQLVIFLDSLILELISDHKRISRDEMIML